MISLMCGKELEHREREELVTEIEGKKWRGNEIEGKIEMIKLGTTCSEIAKFFYFSVMW